MLYQPWKKPSFQCNMCGKPYATQNLLTRHLNLTHSDKCPYECDLCEKAFKTLGRLKVIENINFYKYNFLSISNIFLERLKENSDSSWTTILFNYRRTDLELFIPFSQRNKSLKRIIFFLSNSWIKNIFSNIKASSKFSPCGTQTL